MADSITSILNQPVKYSHALDGSCMCNEDTQCLLAVANQTIYSQLKISPCGEIEVCNNELGEELVCNGDFDLGEELVTNGTFAGSATGWTLGTNWAYQSNDIRATASQAGQTASQTIASLVTAKMYYVSFTVSSYVSGNVAVSVGGTAGTTRAANGTFTQLIICGATTTLSFERVSINFSGDISDVSVKLLDCWELSQAWTWAGGTMCLATAPANLTQSIPAITNGVTYQLVFTISDYVTGNLTAFVGGGTGAAVSADGTYTQFITSTGANTLLDFVDAASFEGCITGISLKELESCWDVDETTWNASAGGACHVAGNTTDLTNTGTVLVSGNYYHVTIAVSGSTAGGINVVLGTTVLTPQSSGNGTFHFWGVSNGVDLIIRPTSTFDGCIAGLTIDEYCNDYQFHIVDEDGIFVEDITHLYDREEDVFNLSGFKFNDFTNSSEARDSLPFGCYKFCLVDCCAEQQTSSSLLMNGNFALGGAFWTPQNTTFSSGFATLTPTSSPAFIQQALITTGFAKCITISFDFGNEAAFNQTISIYIDGVLVDSESLTPGAGSYTNTFENVLPGSVIRFEFSGSDGGGSIILDNIVVVVPEGCQPIYDQCTPCINYKASFNCTKLIEAFCDGNALGFSFDDASGNNQFKLSLRAVASPVHPHYEQEQEDYDYSTGNTSLSSAQSKKFQSLFFDPIPEYKHDVVAIQKVCDTFQIDSVDFFVKKGDYNPEWNRNDATDLAPSRIEVKKKDQTLYNTNCE